MVGQHQRGTFGITTIPSEVYVKKAKIGCSHLGVQSVVPHEMKRGALGMSFESGSAPVLGRCKIRKAEEARAVARFTPSPKAQICQDVPLDQVTPIFTHGYGKEKKKDEKKKNTTTLRFFMVFLHFALYQTGVF